MIDLLGEGYADTLNKYGITEARANEIIQQILDKKNKRVLVMNDRGVTPEAVKKLRQQNTEKSKATLNDIEQGIVGKMLFDEIEKAKGGKKKMAKQDKLKAAAGKAAGAKQTTTTAPKQTEAIMTAGKKSKETVPYTVRIEKDLLKQWKIYTECGEYGDKSKLTEAALTEYMNRHKLTAEQQAKYNALMDL